MFKKKLIKNLFSGLFIIFFFQSYAQDYFGAGNVQGISVSSSPSLQDTLWVNNPDPDNTINGSGLDASYFEVSRFLTQATVAYDESDVAQALSMNFDQWIDDQNNLPIDSLTKRMYAIRDIAVDTCSTCNTNCLPSRVPNYFPSLGWWDQVINANDLLRQKIAYALSQIVVVSRKGTSFSGEGDGVAAYYDILLTHATGNYADLLYDITLNPAMGEYLTHVNNPKTDIPNLIYPDENYAREILQLFSIGLWELNMNGTQKLDVSGNPILTYDNYDIGEYAKIFTGLSYGGLQEPAPQSSCLNASGVSFGSGATCADKKIPMIMYENQHEPGEKHLLNGVIIPSGQTGLEDIRMAIDSLVDHPNTAPFISFRLIQRLIKSNPSPAYISRIANVFKDDGTGQSGNLAAVVKSILLDTEARDCKFLQDDKNSKMREPVLKYAQFVKMISKYRWNGDNYFWNNDGFFQSGNTSTTTKQGFLLAPSVFNFYLPDDVPLGPIKEAGLVAPEFKIFDQVTAPGFANHVDSWTSRKIDGSRILRNGLYTNWCNAGEYTQLYFNDYYKSVDDYEYFINWLDKNFTCGQMTDATRQIIRESIETCQSPSYQSNQQRDRVAMAIYLTILSPDFAIIR